MITSETIIELVEQHIRGTDIFLVEVVVKPGNAIRVHVDRPEGISIDQCVKISRFLIEQLDRGLKDQLRRPQLRLLRMGVQRA